MDGDPANPHTGAPPGGSPGGARAGPGPAGPQTTFSVSRACCWSLSKHPFFGVVGALLGYNYEKREALVREWVCMYVGLTHSRAVVVRLPAALGKPAD